MRFPIKRRAIISQDIRGIGDIVAMAAEPIKRAIINHAPAKIANVMRNCNCGKRRDILNKVIPFEG
jgi:hypothetical protein